MDLLHEKVKTQKLKPGISKDNLAELLKLQRANFYKLYVQVLPIGCH